MRKYELRIIDKILYKHINNDLKLLGMTYNKPSPTKTKVFEWYIDKMHEIRDEKNYNIIDFGIVSYNNSIFTFGAILYDVLSGTYTILYESPRHSYRFDNLHFNKGELNNEPNY